mmetsp:Transcript_101477/g.254372  ORF Transcript_101477/g.254372 Transcript_101477/m.254372 type:complete len:252 (+) Transcript_101477:1451-2206(+)
MPSIRRLLAWTSNMINDEVDDDFHASCPASRNHRLELRCRTRAGVQAKRDWLVSRPPMRAQNVLDNRGDLHGIKAVGPQVILAFTRDVDIVPLPQLHKYRSTSFLATSTSQHLLISAQRAVDRRIGCQIHRCCCIIRNLLARAVGDQLELLPIIDGDCLSSDIALRVCCDVPAMIGLEGNCAVQILHQGELFPQIRDISISKHAAVQLRAYIQTALALQRNCAIRIINARKNSPRILLICARHTQVAKAVG